MANAGLHPTMAKFPPARPVFGYSIRKRHPIIILPYHIMAGLHRPTTHHIRVPPDFIPLFYRRRSTKTICSMSMTRYSRPLTLLRPKSHRRIAVSLSPSTKKPPQHSTGRDKTMSVATTLFKSKCFPTTKSPREAVGVSQATTSS